MEVVRFNMCLRDEIRFQKVLRGVCQADGAPEATTEATYSACTRAAAQRRGQVAENQGAPHPRPRRVVKTQYAGVGK